MDKWLNSVLFGKRWWWWMRHSFFWIIMYLDEILYTLVEQDGLEDLDLFFIPFLLDVLTVYINLYWLIPKFLNQKKYLTYIVLSIATTVINVGLLIAYIYLPVEESAHFGEFVSSLISTITLLATAIAIKVGKFSFEQMQLTEKLKLEQSKLELNSLKQQINPHFLFNVLNTINIQSISEPSAVSETVHQLSDLLRYQIYEAGVSEMVPLQKEIDFLKAYVSLEEIRRSDLEVNWKAAEQLPKIKITPFLFLPLIENAIKHSRSINENPSEIHIDWTLSEHFLKLQVTNTIGDIPSPKSHGFGLDTLKKRLAHLYPGKHELKMGATNRIFSATLILNVDESHNH